MSARHGIGIIGIIGGFALVGLMFLASGGVTVAGTAGLWQPAAVVLAAVLVAIGLLLIFAASVRRRFGARMHVLVTAGQIGLVTTTLTSVLVSGLDPSPTSLYLVSARIGLSVGICVFTIWAIAVDARIQAAVQQQRL
jgi:hypothetical protein